MGKNLLKQLFLLLVIFALVHTVFGQESEITNLVKPANQPVFQKSQNFSVGNQEDTIRESQRGIDRAISILNIVATLMGVLVGLLTIILVVAGAFGIFEYRRWRKIREDIEKEVKESKDKIKEIEKDAKVITEFRQKAEKDADEIREEIRKTPPPPLTEEPTSEIKAKLGEFSRRLEFLETLGVSLEPEDYFNRGFDLYYKGKYDLALKAYEKAIELKPDYADAWTNKGVTLDELGRYEEALKAYEKAIELKPDDADVWTNKGDALVDLGRYEEALKASEKAIELNPDLAEAWANKGDALGGLGRYDEALKASEKAIELNPDLADAWYGLACVYSLKDDEENALKNLSKAIELNPKCKEDAKKDKDFKNLWDDEDFKKLVK